MCTAWLLQEQLFSPAVYSTFYCHGSRQLQGLAQCNLQVRDREDAHEDPAGWTAEHVCGLCKLVCLVASNPESTCCLAPSADKYGCRTFTELQDSTALASWVLHSPH